MNDDNLQQNRLLDEYARNIPGREGAELIAQAVQNLPLQTRYALENARSLFSPTRFQGLFLMSQGNPQFQQFIFQSEDDNALVVMPFDGENPTDEPLAIAKAIGLRRFDYEGKIYNGWRYAYVNKNTRTATNDGSVDSNLNGVVETQRITPDYADETNSTIIGISVIQGFNEQLEETVWIDANLVGRCWAKVSSL